MREVQVRNPTHPFEIAVQAAPRAEPVFLQSAEDADQATALFHVAAAQLRDQGVKGDLIVLNRHRGRKPVLRQPLNAAVADRVIG